VFEVRVGAQTEISVSLAEDAMALDAVEIRSTGYWSDTKARSVGNIAKVSSEDIERQPVTSPLMSLQGRMAGVDVQPTGGIPGSAIKIQIRGQNSLRNDGNYPLYVIDGIPVDSRPLDATAISMVGAFDPLSTINPANIESIQVLKDADATSIYGSRGANGVILITTKQAGKSGKTTVDVSGYRGVGQVAKFLDVMNTQQYLGMRREAFRNDGIEIPSYEYDLTTWDTTRYTDWQKTLIGGTADISDVQAGISGGNANTSFRLGGGYHKETLVFPGDFGYRRLAGNFNMNHLSPNQKLRLSLTINYGSEKNTLFDDSRMMTNALTLPPHAPRLYTDEGQLNWENSSVQNPLAGTRNVHTSNTDNLMVNADIIYNIYKGLDVKVNTGFTSLNGVEAVISPLAAIDPAYVKYYTGSLNDGSNVRKTWIVEPQMSYNTRIGGSELNIVVGGTWQEGRYASKMVEKSGYTSDALIGTVGAATNINIARDVNNEYKYIAVFARMGYNWKEKYFINLTGRRDGSSRFSPENRFANFGSVGAAWIFTEEPFMNGVKSFISFGKLRSSYGSTGSDQIGDYMYIDTYKATGRYQGNPSLYPAALYNPDYQWEATRKFEAAIEAKFWNSRISLEAAYYQNRSSNQLIDIALPYATGFASYFGNFNPLIENRGWEFTLGTENIRSGHFRWTTNVNLTIPRNELVSFSDLEASSYRDRYVVGKPLSILKLYTYQGINPETGRYKFVDEDNSGSLGTEDRQYVYNFGRQYYGGINNTIGFRNFDLSFLLQYVDQSAKTYLGAAPGQSSNLPVEMLDRWQRPGDNAKYQLYTSQYYGPIVDDFSRYSDSNAAIEDASFFRLKTLTLSYTVPMTALQRIRLAMVRVYVQGQNLFTITSYNGLDPETGAVLPPLRILTMGIQVKL
jgi:TonB-dependent starch-binding outer membrane protein SusC